jgi:small-conductance mechanosensitive channel
MDRVLVSSINLIALDSWYMKLYFCCSESSFSHDTDRDLQRISGNSTSKVGHLSMKEVRIADLAIFSTMLLSSSDTVIVNAVIFSMCLLVFTYSNAE